MRFLIHSVPCQAVNDAGLPCLSTTSPPAAAPSPPCPPTYPPSVLGLYGLSLCLPLLISLLPLRGDVSLAEAQTQTPQYNPLWGDEGDWCCGEKGERWREKLRKRERGKERGHGRERQREGDREGKIERCVL